MNRISKDEVSELLQRQLVKQLIMEKLLELRALLSDLQKRIAGNSPDPDTQLWIGCPYEKLLTAELEIRRLTVELESIDITT
jgi:hypothetical protein